MKELYFDKATGRLEVKYNDDDDYIHGQIELEKSIQNWIDWNSDIEIEITDDDWKY